jgi:hypothetical protein
MPYDSYAVIRALVRAEAARTSVASARKPADSTPAPKQEPSLSSEPPEPDDTSITLSA